MNIEAIYKQIGIPPNLAEHMFRVAAVTKFLCKYWIGEKLDWQQIIKTALLHDIGNIVKFDFDKYPQFLGEETVNIDYWKEKQRESVAKYGSDDHEATRKILEELNLDEHIIKIILGKSFGNSIDIAKSVDWYQKILYTMPIFGFSQAVLVP